MISRRMKLIVCKNSSLNIHEIQRSENTDDPNLN